MLIIPSLELENGICSHCITGEPGTEGMYHNLQNHPEQLIKLLRRENFKALHIIDKDSLLHGKDVDFDLIKKITEAVDIPVELHADYKNQYDCKIALESGLYRLIISNEMLLNIDFCRQLIKDFSPSRICFGIILHNNELWDSTLKQHFTPPELINNLVSNGAKRILLGTYNSVFIGDDIDLKQLELNFSNKNFRVTVYGGINTPEKLWEISRDKSRNIDSVIIGQAIFGNAFPCQKIWRLIEAELEK